MALKYEDIKQAFIDEVNKDKTVTKLYAQIRGGDATYATAGQLAQRIGADLGKVLMRNAPLENIDEWDIDDLIPKALGLDHRMITTACKQVQESMNKDAGVGIKYQEPKFNMDKAMGIVKELRDNPEYANIEKTFYDQIENFSKSVVDDSIIANASTLWKAGIKTVVVRIAENGCCNWCEERAGTYNYVDVKEPGNDVWRRHENCNCTIDFYTEKNGTVYRERVKDNEETDKSLSAYDKSLISPSGGENNSVNLDENSIPKVIETALKGSNPMYGLGPQYECNCQRSVQAYEMRRRGLEVRAMPAMLDPMDEHTIIWGNECFIDSNGNVPDFSFFLSETSIKEILADAPDGSRHVIYIQWKDDSKHQEYSAHDFIAEKIDDKIYYIDPMTGAIDVEYYFSQGIPNEFGIVRLDDKQIKKDKNVLLQTVARSD